MYYYSNQYLRSTVDLEFNHSAVTRIEEHHTGFGVYVFFVDNGSVFFL
jgi:hypothetical protein